MTCLCNVLNCVKIQLNKVNDSDSSLDVTKEEGQQTMKQGLMTSKINRQGQEHVNNQGFLDQLTLKPGRLFYRLTC